MRIRVAANKTVEGGLNEGVTSMHLSATDPGDVDFLKRLFDKLNEYPAPILRVSGRGPKTENLFYSRDKSKPKRATTPRNSRDRVKEAG